MAMTRISSMMDDQLFSLVRSSAVTSATPSLAVSMPLPKNRIREREVVFKSTLAASMALNRKLEYTSTPARRARTIREMMANFFLFSLGFSSSTSPRSCAK